MYDVPRSYVSRVVGLSDRDGLGFLADGECEGLLPLSGIRAERGLGRGGCGSRFLSEDADVVEAARLRLSGRRGMGALWCTTEAECGAVSARDVVDTDAWARAL